MAPIVKTSLSESDLLSLCLEFSLGALLEWRPVLAGTVNSNYRLRTSTGCFFLRVNEGKSEADVRYEVGVLLHVGSRGVLTPLPLQASSGARYCPFQDKFISVFPWREGTHSTSENISTEQCRSLGRALAQLHRAGEGMTAPRAGRYTLPLIHKMYEGFASSDDAELLSAVAIIGEEFTWLRNHRKQRESLETGLIHADLFPDNVLLDGDSVAALIDFEQACIGSYCYDLAVCVNAWCFSEVTEDRCLSLEKHPIASDGSVLSSVCEAKRSSPLVLRSCNVGGLEVDRLRALLAGYTSSRSLSFAESVGLLVELRVSALRFTVTRIRDVYLETPRARSGAVVEEGRSLPAESKDFRRFLMRLQTWQAISQDEFAELAEGFFPR